MHEEVANAVLGQKEAIADLVSAEHYAAHPEFEKRWGEAGKKKCREDAVYHVLYLAEAIRFDAEELFVDYVAWVKVLLISLQIPERDLSENLSIVNSALEKMLSPEQFAVAGSFVAAGLRALPNLPSQTKTFLPEGAPHRDLAEKWLGHLLKHEAREGRQLIFGALQDGVPLREIYAHVFAPALHEVGRLWQRRKISEAEEHYCTEATQRLLAILSAEITAERVRRSVVGFSVEEEQHDVGIHLVMDCFSIHGWDSVCFGKNVPTLNIPEVVVRWEPEVVALSVTMTYHLAKVRDVIRAVRALEVKKVPKIIVGGRPFAVCEDLAAKLGADGSGKTCADVIGGVGL